MLVRVGALAAVLAPAAISAQAATGVALDRYTFAEPHLVGVSAVELRAVPFDLVVPLASNFRVEGTGAFAQGSITSAHGERTELSGLSDAEIALAVQVAGRVLLRGTVAPILPTSTLSRREAQVAGAIASELLPFSVAPWGSGGSMGVDLGVVAPLGGFDFALLVGVRSQLEQDILDDETTQYLPGDQLRVRASIDARVGRTGALSLVGAVQTFGRDRWGGADVYRAGVRGDGLISYAFPVGLEGSALVFAGIRHRARADLLTDSSAFQGVTRSSVFQGVIRAPQQQMARAGMRLRATRGRLSFVPDAELRVARSDGVVCYQSAAAAASFDVVCPAEQGWLASAGGALELRLAGGRAAKRIVVSPHARVRIGQMVAVDGFSSDLAGVIVKPADGGRSGVTGWQVGVGLRMDGAR